MRIKELEIAVMKKMLSGEDRTLIGLRQQIEAIEDRVCKKSGVGFVTSYHVNFQRLNATFTPSSVNFRIGDVGARHNALKNGIGFLLYISDGTINTLEGYTYGEPWPEDLSEVELYLLDKNRNELLNDLRSL